MFLTPTETAGFENVGSLLEAFRSELEKSGFSGQAEALRGIEVLGLGDAETALLVLRDMAPSTRDLDLIKRHIESNLTSMVRSAAA